MSVSICASCLSRLRIVNHTSSPLSVLSTLGQSSFHTSSTQYALPPKKKVGGRTNLPKFREARGATIKKKKQQQRPRPPAVGERKAALKRIVLSNTNALEVPGMVDLTAENMSDASKISEMMTLEGSLLDRLRDAKAFKTTQNWNMFRKPATLMRQETAELGMDFEDVTSSLQAEGSEAKFIQRIIAGERLSGKSILLLQAMSMGFLNNWVVINVPEAQDYTINTSSYAPISGGKEEQLYVQPNLTSALLSRIAHANSAVLSKLSLTHKHSSSKLPIEKKMSLKGLAMLGVEDASIAWPAWQALWKELTAPAPSADASRPPILVAIDGIDHWMGLTRYRSSDFKFIHAHQFVFIQQVMSLLFSPQTKLPHGGMILAATSGSNSPLFPSWSILLRQLVARAAGQQMTDEGFPLPEPYQKVDQRILDLFSGSQATQVQQLKGLSRQEAKGLLEYFARSGILKEAMTDEVVGEKWTLSGGGIVGEIAKFGKRVRL